MAAFDQSSFARAVQKREAKKSSRNHSKSSSTNTSVFRRKDTKNDKENILSLSKKDKSGKENNSCSEMTMKKKLLGKLFKILTLKESSTKKCTKEEKKLCHTRKRSRSSQSSTPSNFEPMPTIYEEDDEESDLISLQSFCIHKQTYNMTVAVA